MIRPPSDVGRPPTRFLALLMLFQLAWGALYVLRTAIPHEGALVFCLWDDAMISMRYARNLAEGHGLVWNPGGERVQGFSNPAVTLAMAALHALGIRPERVALAVQGLELAALAASLWLVARAARDLFAEDLRVGAAAALAAVACAPIAIWALQGADSGFVSLWLVACVAALARAGPRRWPAALGAALALGPLVRPDAAVFSAVLLAGSLAYPGTRWRRLVAGGALLAATAAAWLGFGWLYYGDPLPNTFHLKATGSPRPLVLQVGIAQLAGWLPGLAPALAAAGLAWLRRRRDPRLAVAGALVLSGFAWSVWAGGDWLPERGIRYAVPVLPILLLLAAGGCADLARGLAARARVPAAAATVLCFAAAAATGLAASPRAALVEWLDPRAETLLRAQNQLGYRHAVYLREHTRADTTVAVHWAGVLPYFAERRAIDVLGRSDRHIASLRVPRFLPGHSKWDWDYVLGERRPDVIDQLSRGLGAHPLLRERYVRVEAPDGIGFFLRRRAIPKLADDSAEFFDVATQQRYPRRPRPRRRARRAQGWNGPLPSCSRIGTNSGWSIARRCQFAPSTTSVWPVT